MPDQQVLEYGDAIGRHGADVISVDVKTGEVTLWDSKYRSGDVKLGESPTFTKDVSRNFAIAEAERAISESKLPDDIKNNSLFFLEIRTFKANTVAAGNARNSVQSVFVNGKFWGDSGGLVQAKAISIRFGDKAIFDQV